MTSEEHIESTVMKILSDYVSTPSWWPFGRYPKVIDMNKKLISELKIDDDLILSNTTDPKRAEDLFQTKNGKRMKQSGT